MRSGRFGPRQIEFTRAKAKCRNSEIVYLKKWQVNVVTVAKVHVFNYYNGNSAIIA